ncbi:similar to Saccharomyces cerevisiae YHL030W ECM29 Scaffold protein that assists in association of the proteasome core particle with the regulatory particle [Maudiozyma saulgeensis]|uniref:Similar to Saccharomyces cerevisiae YHL030W ECM29 Scaffold protein that assists in association of the proteasome core particle with the regulatory particle n=1 Tax=Maudiozyma saulgeensis TaxID=1789683 RepID=A0A1X7R458_9SACH|nr:similar to Saccharomyces cerevisiae YHL030W ECM29 Scaffold protein that assists in association of the proteasome core particle with the regulatory particle [Kazachstania saulgeensis]
MDTITASEKKELDLIEKVELRLALSDTTEKFEKSLNTFLAPLLLKLASPYASVRQAVFNTLKHVLSRLSSLKTLRLPVAALIIQAKSPSIPEGADPKNVRLYSLLLASKGVERLTTSEQKALIPEVMKDISRMSRDTAARLFHILCKLLLSWVPPLKGSTEENETKELLKLDSNEDLEFILNYFTKFFLLKPAKPNPQAGVIPRGYTSPGLSSDDVSFFTYEAGISFTSEQMFEFKRAIFKFSCNGLVEDDNKLIKFLSVVCTDESSISDSAIQFLKRLQTPYEDSDFINFLINLFTGDKTRGVPPVKHELQERILTILNNSIVATQDPDKVLLICSIGLNSEFYKLKSFCLLFIRHVSRNNGDQLVHKPETSEPLDYHTNIASLIRNNLHSEGWPKLQLGSSTPQFNNVILQRRLQYETLGDIIRKDFDMVKDLSYIEFLLDSLNGDLIEFSSSIQESLVAATCHLPLLPEASKAKLKTILRKYLADDYQLENEPETKERIMALRFIAIKFANVTFEFNDTEARFFNILGTSRTNRFDIIEESIKGLHPHWFRINKAAVNKQFLKTEEILGTKVTDTKFPDSKEMSMFIINELELNKENETSVLRSTLNCAVRFIKQCIIMEAISGKQTVIVQDEDWSVRTEKAVEMDPIVISYISSFISSITDAWYSKLLKIICSEFVVKSSNGNIIAFSKYHDVVFGKTLLLFIKFTKLTVLYSLEPLITDLYKYLDGTAILNDEELEMCANILAIISVSCPNSSNVTNIISSLDHIETTEISLRDMFANANILPRLYITNQLENVTEARVLALIKTISNNIMEHKSKKILYRLMGQIGKFGLFCHLPKQKREIIVRTTIDLLKTRLLNDEFTVELWGCIAIYANEFNLMDEFYGTLYETHVSKQIEYLFASGETLSIIAGGWTSTVLTDQVDVGEHSKQVIDKLGAHFYNEANVSYVLDKILHSCDSSKPSLRKASCVWLLSLVQFLKQNPIIIQNAKEIHNKFMKFLGDNDELIQDTSSRGLSLIYEIGTGDLREDMVKGLLKSFTNSTNAMSMQSGTLDQETKLFEPGTMNTGDGSISTYKDILNLASEVGDPSLVYKFMSLAKSSSLWSSRKGIAFGLGAIMSKSSLENMLLEDTATATKLIPKLYRYRFDPYSAVARSMTDIWNSLISDSSNVISKYFDVILEELLDGMSDKEWRVREASTNGLLNLVQSQPNEKFADRILDIWTMGFRTMDDIKESVREAGVKFTTVLGKILARSIDISKGVSSERSKKILDSILPFFLGTKGINSDADDVRKFALTTLIELVKNTGDSIKPFAPKLVYEFTLLFSSIEPQVINYLSLNATNYNVDSKIIDVHRKNGITSSPLFETIDKLISHSDKKNLIDFVDYSMKAVKKSIGLPSKVASAQVLVLLAKRFVIELAPYSGKLLKLCLVMLDDRNESVSHSFATTFGYMYKISSVEKAAKYGNKLVEKYFDIDGSNDFSTSKRTVGIAIESILDHASSQFGNVANIFMPLIFVACNDVVKENAELFNKIWTDASSTGSGTIKLYLDEILSILSKNIKSNNFDVRKTCAKSIQIVSEKVDTNINSKQRKHLFDLSIASLEGRTWDGKEMMVEALCSLAITFKDDVSQDIELKEKINKSLKVEVARTNKMYVKKIILFYAEYLGAFEDKEGNIDQLLTVINDTIQEVGSSNDGSVDATRKETVSSQNENEITKKASKKNIGAEEYILKLIDALVPFAKISMTNMNFKVEYLQALLHLIAKCFDNNLYIYTWRTQLSSCEIGKKLISDYDSNSDEIDKILSSYWEVVFQNNITKETIENVKLQMINFGSLLSQKVPNLKSIIEESMRRMTDSDPNPRLVLEIKNNGF